MVRKADEKPFTRTAEIMKRAMEKQGLSIRDVAAKVDVVYEHIANMLRPGSKSIPPERLRTDIARVLKIDKHELTTAGVADAIEKKKWTSFVMEMAKKNPELEPIERDWPKLSKEHKADIIAMVQTFAKRDSAV